MQVVLYCIVLHYIALYCIVLHCIVFYNPPMKMPVDSLVSF